MTGALTTAHFYTPSGRLIQRDYTNKSFHDYYFHKGDDTKNPLDVKMTEGGPHGIRRRWRFTGAEMQTLRLRCRICRPVRLQGGARRAMPRAAGQKWRALGPAV